MVCAVSEANRPWGHLLHLLMHNRFVQWQEEWYFPICAVKFIPSFITGPVFWWGRKTRKKGIMHVTFHSRQHCIRRRQNLLTFTCPTHCLSCTRGNSTYGALLTRRLTTPRLGLSPFACLTCWLTLRSCKLTCKTVCALSLSLRRIFSPCALSTPDKQKQKKYESWVFFDFIVIVR